MRANHFVTGPLFAPLFAAYPLLFIAVSNPGQAAWATIGAALIVALVVSLALLVAQRVMFGSWNRAALGVTLVAFLFYAYGPAHTAAEGIFLDSINDTSGLGIYLQRISPYLHWIMTAVWAVAGLLALRRLARVSESAIAPAALACNSMALVLLALLSVQWIAQNGAASVPNADGPRDVARGRAVSVLGYNPDVYVIVLDGYARGDVLQRYYAFDNSVFLDGLKTRGFQVSDGSTANYNWTFLSLASVLNMDYLQPLLGDRIAPSVRDRAQVYDAVRNNAAARFLKERGYRTVHFQTTWGATLRNPYADEQVACHQGVFTNEFYRVVAEASWLKALQPRMSADIARCHLSNLERLADMGRQPGPKFVFAHFLPPHHPYLFDRQGNILRNANLSNQFEFQKRLWEEKGLYVDQLVYMNARITDAVDRILAASPHPPIIIIQSDHGPNFEDNISRDEHVRIRLANLTAFRLPEAPEHLVPVDASAVNELRHIFNHYFDARFDILPSRHYYSEYNSPYAFTDVTLLPDQRE
jgi:hypothetical protein